MGKLQRVALTLPGDLKTEARIKAIREGLTLSEVVRRYLTAYVKGDNPPEEKEPKT